ncbi:hypothetical protein EDD11_005578 [Mortierella claussenii]|nr:hypothetical protein EDD11_005578 [Mortierella claussenii]
MSSLVLAIPELLELLADNLSLHDRVSCAATCKAWHHYFVPYVYRNIDTTRPPRLASIRLYRRHIHTIDLAVLTKRFAALLAQGLPPASTSNMSAAPSVQDSPGFPGQTIQGLSIRRLSIQLMTDKDSSQQGPHFLPVLQSLVRILEHCQFLTILELPSTFLRQGSWMLQKKFFYTLEHHLTALDRLVIEHGYVGIEVTEALLGACLRHQRLSTLKCKFGVEGRSREPRESRGSLLNNSDEHEDDGQGYLNISNANNHSGTASIGNKGWSDSGGDNEDDGREVLTTMSLTELYLDAWMTAEAQVDGEDDDAVQSRELMLERLAAGPASSITALVLPRFGQRGYPATRLDALLRLRLPKLFDFKIPLMYADSNEVLCQSLRQGAQSQVPEHGLEPRREKSVYSSLKRVASDFYLKQDKLRHEEGIVSVIRACGSYSRTESDPFVEGGLVVFTVRGRSGARNQHVPDRCDMMDELVIWHSRTLVEFILDDCNVKSDQLQRILETCRCLQVFSVRSTSAQRSAALEYKDIARSEWVCADQLQRLDITLGGDQGFQGQETEQQNVNGFMDIEHDQTFVESGSTLSRVYGRLGQLRNLTALCIALDDSDQRTTPMEEMVEHLTACQWLCKLKNLKKLRRFEMNSPFWNVMGQRDAEFMNDQWPALKELVFGNNGRRNVLQDYGILDKEHWKWLQKQRPQVQFLSNAVKYS